MYYTIHVHTYRDLNLYIHYDARALATLARVVYVEAGVSKKFVQKHQHPPLHYSS